MTKQQGTETQDVERASKRGRGRPAKYESAAEKQKAYRERLNERLRADGLKLQQCVVIDRGAAEPKLKSGLIDLSALPAWKRAD